jgi:hypothetical protein
VRDASQYLMGTHASDHIEYRNTPVEMDQHEKPRAGIESLYKVVHSVVFEF